MFPIQRKGRARKVTVKPFPNTTSRAYFTGLDFEIFDACSVAEYYESGQLGTNPKPRQTNIGQQHSINSHRTTADDPSTGHKNDEKITNLPESIVLFLEEAFFLHYNLKCLDVYDLDDRAIATDDLWNKLCSLKEKFVECFVAYIYLKSKNLVIKPGLKFGGDFLLYKHGPHLHHASFVAIVSKRGKSTFEYHNNQRIAETTGKNLLYLEVFNPHELTSKDFLNNIDKFEVKELLIQRREMIKHK